MLPRLFILIGAIFFLSLPLKTQAQDKKVNDVLSIDTQKTYRSRDYSIDKFHVPVWKRMDQKYQKFSVRRVQKKEVRKKKRNANILAKEALKASRKASRDQAETLRQQQRDQKKLIAKINRGSVRTAKDNEKVLEEQKALREIFSDPDSKYNRKLDRINDKENAHIAKEQERNRKEQEKVSEAINRYNEQQRQLVEKEQLQQQHETEQNSDAVQKYNEGVLANQQAQQEQLTDAN
jgi:hypothetical protein